MKTLDEVIDNFEKACDLERRCEGCSGCLDKEYGCPNDGAECVPDALHYLKVLQKMQKAQPLEKSEWDELYNQPLTWDELKTMEGKPVWVEYDPKRFPALDNRWGIATTSFTSWEGSECWTLVRPGAEYVTPVSEYGKTWQAYRKERE